MQTNIWMTKNNPDFSKLKFEKFTSQLSLALKTFLLFLDSTLMLPSFKERYKLLNFTEITGVIQMKL